jgi:hypothetical protein
VRLEYIHQNQTEAMLAEIQKNYGYVLIVDGTGDGDSERIVLCLDVLTDWVLAVEQVPSESEENVVKILQKVRSTFGVPLACICDLGSGIQKAVATIFPGVILRDCNFHFVKDVASDILQDNYTQFKSAIIKFGVQVFLKRLRKDLYAVITEKNIDVNDNVKALVNKQIEGRKFDECILSVTYDTISWILRYHEDDEGMLFPFALPYLNFFQRCSEGLTIIQNIRQCAALGNQSPKYLRQVETMLKELVNGSGETAITIRRLFHIVTENFKMVTQLREILRIPRTQGNILREDLAIEQKAAIQHLQEQLEDFRNALDEITGVNARAARIIGGHLDIYKGHLLIDNIEIEVDGEKKTIVIPRTSAAIKQRIGEIKKLIRGRTRKMSINYELNRYGSLLGIASNLNNDSYVTVMYGSKDQICTSFLDLPHEVIQQKCEQVRMNARGYDITKPKLRQIPRSPLVVLSGIESLKEVVEKRMIMRQFYPPELFGQTSNRFLTL